MKLSIALGSLSLAAVATAQVSSERCLSLTALVPACITDCIASAAVTNAGCSYGDYGCQCSKSQSNIIVLSALACARAACSTISGTEGISSFLSASKSAHAVCECLTATATVTSTTATVTKTTSTSPTTVTSTSTSNPGPTVTTSSTTTTSSSSVSTITTAPLCTDSISPCEASKLAIPACGNSCLISAGSAVGCSSADYQCQCSQFGSIQGLALDCVTNGCGVATAIDVLNSAQGLCSCVTASPTTPCATTTGTTTSVTSTSTSSSTGITKIITTITTTTSGPVTSCIAGTTQDCGPVASAIPSCALACFNSAIPVAGCGLTDYSCQCSASQYAQISAAVVPCVAAACPAATLGAVIASAGAVCSCASAAPVGGSCTTIGGGDGGGVITTPTTKPTTTTGPVTSCVSGSVPNCAASASAIPSCAQACFSSVIPGAGCGISDYECQCSSSQYAKISASVVPCVATACPASELANVITAAGNVCSCASAGVVGGTCPTSTGAAGGGGGGDVVSPSGTKSPVAGETCVAVSGTTKDCGPVASAIPACAIPCFNSAIPKAGCGLTDFACQCSSSQYAVISAGVVGCVATACPAASIAAVITSASAVCACATAAPVGGSTCAATGTGAGGAGQGTTKAGGTSLQTSTSPVKSATTTPATVLTSGSELTLGMSSNILFGSISCAALAMAAMLAYL